MKIAASDFDCTLFFPPQYIPGKDGIAEDDIAAVNKWHDAGHIFGIVTGRNRHMLLKDSQRYGLHFDFAVCLTGAAIYDENMNIIHQSPIDAIVSSNVIALPILRQSKHILCFTANNAYVHIQSEASWFKKPTLLSELTQVDFNTAAHMEKICQISLQYDGPEQAAAAAEQINVQKLGVTAYRNVQALDIVKNDVSKSVGLNIVLQANNWQKNKILTIGDSPNDLPMIRQFNGFTINSADKDVKKHAAKIYDNVADMLMNNL